MRGVLVGILLCWTSATFAQDSSESPPVTSIESLAPGLHLIEKSEAGEVRLRSDNSQTSAQILGSAQERLRLQKASEVFDIQKVEIKGTIRGSVVDLDIDLLINIEPPDEWVRVPIGFADLYITELTHSAEAEEGKGRFDKTKLPQKSWQLYGSGIHQIKMKMLGNITEEVGGQYRFRPAAPRATVSHMVLKIPQKVDTVDITPQPRPHEVRPVDSAAASELETWGLEPETQFSWFPRRTTADEDVEIRITEPATMSLDLATTTLNVQQPIAITGGALTELSVKLPPGFRAHSIRAEDENGQNIVEPLSDADEGLVLIQFESPVIDNVILDYDLRLLKTAFPQNISVRVPDLQDTADDSANIEIVTPSGLGVEFTRLNENNVRQKRVEGVGGERTSVVAWQLLSDKAQLNLKVSETEAFYSVSPTIVLEANRSTLLLTGRFNINTVQGSLKETKIAWPQLAEEGWTILGVRMKRSGEVEEVPVPWEATPDGESALQLNFSSRQVGSFEISLQAVRDLAGLDTEAQILHLPDIETPTPHTTTVALQESDEFRISVSPPIADSEVPFPELPVSRLPEDFRKGPTSAWLIESITDGIRLSLKEQQARVSAQLLAELSIANGSIHIHEAIDFDVSYLDLDEVSLVSDIEPTVRVEDNDQPLKITQNESGVLTYALPGKRRGKFRLLVDYYWPPSPDENTRAGSTPTLPLILPSADNDLSEVIVATNRPRAITPRDSKLWSRVHVQDFAAAWRSTSPVESVEVELRESLTELPEITPHFCVLNSVVQGDTLLTSTTTVLDNPTEALLYSLDRSCTVYKAYVGDSDVKFTVVSEDDQFVTYQIRSDTSETTDETVSVTLMYHQPLRERRALFSRIQPVFPKIVGGSDLVNGVWIIGEGTGSTVLHFGERLNELQSWSLPFLTDSSSEVSSQISSLLSPYPADVRRAILERFQDLQSQPENNLLLAGPIHGSTSQLVIVPRQTVLLAIAAFGLVIYLTFVRLSNFGFITVLVLLSAGLTAVSSIAPGPAWSLITKLLPGGGIAVIAAFLQRLLAGTPVAAPAKPTTSDETTIFTFDQVPDATATPASEIASTALTS